MSTESLQSINDKMEKADSKQITLMKSRKFWLLLSFILIIVIVCIAIAIWLILAKDKEEIIPIKAVTDLEPPNKYTKLLVVGGYTGDDYLNSTEVLDLTDASLMCTPLPDYPFEMSFLSGDLINETTLLFCGGWEGSSQFYSECFFMQANGTSPAPSLSAPLSLADSVAINGSLYVTGGYNEDSSTINKTEFIHSNSTEPGPDLLDTERRHCLVQINETDILLISRMKTTAFYNISAKEWREGPNMQFRGYKSRSSSFGCGLLYFNGGMVAVVAGRGPKYTFTEMLDFSAPMGYLHWEFGPELPSFMYDIKMVSFNKTVVIVGGYADDGASAKLLILKCIDTIVSNCYWDEMKHELSTGRYGHEAIMIPDEMTKCTYPI